MIKGAVARHELVRERPLRVGDGRGNFEDDWTTAPNVVTLEGWSVDAGATSEDLQNRDGRLIQYTVRGPLNADVQAGDRIQLFGQRFSIVGGVMRQPGVSPFTSHTILQLASWEG